MIEGHRDKHQTFLILLDMELSVLSVALFFDRTWRERASGLVVYLALLLLSIFFLIHSGWNAKHMKSYLMHIPIREFCYSKNPQQQQKNEEMFKMKGNKAVRIVLCHYFIIIRNCSLTQKCFFCLYHFIMLILNEISLYFIFITNAAVLDCHCNCCCARCSVYGNWGLLVFIRKTYYRR